MVAQKITNQQQVRILATVFYGIICAYAVHRELVRGSSNKQGQKQG
jgi:hypothetical protein